MKYRVKALLKCHNGAWEQVACEIVDCDASDTAWQIAAERIAEAGKIPRAVPRGWHVLEVEKY